MKLTLTIQDVKGPEGLFKGVFGTLNVSAPDSKGVYSKKEDINFTAPIDNIKGLAKIVRNIQVEILAAKHEERMKKLNEKRKVAKKNRKTNKV